jgi:hypothetical protein
MSILSNLLEATKVVHARHSKIAAYVSALVAIPILVACAHTHPGVAHCTILLQSSHCVEVPVEEEVVAAQARTSIQHRLEKWRSTCCGPTHNSATPFRKSSSTTVWRRR